MRLGLSLSLTGLRQVLDAGSPAAPFFISGLLHDVNEGANAGFAIDVTNAISYAQTVATDPNDPLVVYVCWYNASAGQICVAKSTTGPTGDFATTVGTADTTPAITDSHRTISAFVDSTSRLNVSWRMHGEPMTYWRAPSPGDTLITDLTKIFPLVVANTAAEGAATYPQNAPFTNGDVLFTWRTGGSGNGLQYLYLVSGTTITSISAPWLEDDGDISFYLNTLCIEGADSAVPDRIWVSVQVRDTNVETTAHDLYCFYCDKANLVAGGWKAFDGSALTVPILVSGLAAALVDPIPIGTEHYYGFQGMAVGLDGKPSIVMWYGTTGVDWYMWGYRYTGSTWTKKKLYDIPADIVLLARPKCVWKGNRLVALFSEATTSGGSNLGKARFATAVGDTLADVAVGDIFVRNGINNVGNSSLNHDQLHWRDHMAESETGPLIYWQRTDPIVNPGSNGPLLLQTAFVSIQPVLRDPVEIFGANALDFYYRMHDSAVDDGSGKAVTLNDLSGNARHVTQSTPGSRGTITPGALNGRTSLILDGVDDFYNLTLSRPAPSGAAPYFVYWVGRQKLWTSGDRLFDFNGATLFQTGSSPGVRINHGTTIGASITNWTISGTPIFRRGKALFTGAAAGTADYVQIGGTGVTGFCGSTISNTNVTLGALAGGAGLWANWEPLEIFGYRAPSGGPTAKQLYDLDGYTSALYGAGPV